jgi:hypothetical protein
MQEAQGREKEEVRQEGQEAQRRACQRNIRVVHPELQRQGLRFGWL